MISKNCQEEAILGGRQAVKTNVFCENNNKDEAWRSCKKHSFYWLAGLDFPHIHQPLSLALGTATWWIDIKDTLSKTRMNVPGCSAKETVRSYKVVSLYIPQRAVYLQQDLGFYLNLVLRVSLMPPCNLATGSVETPNRFGLLQGDVLKSSLKYVQYLEVQNS